MERVAWLKKTLATQAAAVCGSHAARKEGDVIL
jgi:hypothetical protein